MSTDAPRAGGPPSPGIDFDEIDLYRHRIVSMGVADPATGRPIIGTDGRPALIGVRCRDSDPCLIEGYRTQSLWQCDDRSVSLPYMPEDFLLEREISKAAAATAFWQNIVLDGQKVVLSKDSAAALYRRFPWILEQVRATAHDLSRYSDPALPTDASLDTETDDHGPQPL